MAKRRPIWLIFMLVAGCVLCHAAPKAVLSDQLSMLDRAMADAPRYRSAKLMAVDSMRRHLRELPATDVAARWHTTMQIAYDMRTFNADSALKYSYKALELSPQVPEAEAETRSRISVLNSLSAAGIFSEGEAVARVLASTPMSKDVKVKYWIAVRQLYAYMESYLHNETDFARRYHMRSLEYDDSLLAALPTTDVLHRFLSGERAVVEGRYLDAKKQLEFLLADLPENSRLYGMTAFQLAEVYRNMGSEEEYASYLAKAAECDIKCSINEGLALPTLAKWLYEQGDLSGAFRYINFALQGATEGNARMRTASITESMPLIDEAYRDKINKSRNVIVVFLVVTILIAIVCAVLLFFVVRQVKRAQVIRKKLEAATAVRESYIGNFVGLCSVYADKLDSLSKLVGRKLSSGQADDLLKLVKSGKLAEAENENFYKIFDTAFLDIYPDFLFSFNRLLRDDEQIELKKGQKLTPELRIYALVRLGVDESGRISQILRYSPNTVYAYRNKLRNKAVNRETFEADVMAIGRNH